MADKFTPEKRSEIMSKIRGKDTAPELTVRRIAHALGYRFRLHDGKLPGKPDMVFRRLRKVVFVNGCFWHWHNCREGRRTPKSNVGYWVGKRSRNRGRDKKARAALKKLGWEILVVWQCQCKDAGTVAKMLGRFLEG